MSDTQIEKAVGGEQVEDKLGTGDYSGASKKTDPDEIRLVRKLDRRIVVSRCHLSLVFVVAAAETQNSRACGQCTSSTTSTATLFRRQD